MLQRKSIAIALGLLYIQLINYPLHGALKSLLNNDCFAVTPVNCKSNCDNDKIKCPSDSDDIFNKTFFAIRPQDSNAARRILVGRTRSELFYDFFCTKINLSLEWQQSFNSSKLAKWFSFNCNNCMTIGIPGAGQTFDINGNQFGLNTIDGLPGPIGTICLKPKLRNLIADLDAQINLDYWVCGLWARVDVPLVWCQTDLGLSILNNTVLTGTSFPPGFFTIDCSVTPAQTIKAGLESSSCGKFAHHRLNRVNVAGIHLDLGYDFVRNECGNLGISLHLVTPTGTKPKSRFLFEPIIGANRCFQIGANVNGQYSYLDECDDINFSVMFDATLTHLFKSKQQRLFGLKNNGPGSQFLLLKQFNAIGTAILGLNSIANVLCGKTKIGNDFMFDGAIMGQISTCRAFFDVGYNFWFRSKEKRDRTVDFRNFAENSLGIKGNLPLSDLANISCPTGGCVSNCIPNILTANNSTINQSAAPDATPTFISISDIDFCLPLHPAALSHKVFGAIGWNWCNSCDNFYELLIGGEIEFGQFNRALDQWGLIIKWGIAF